MSKLKDILRQTGFVQGAIRAPEDYYITPPIAVEELLKREKFIGVGWECASGNGAIAKFFPGIMASDIRKDDDIYGEKGVDFLKTHRKVDFIITNPPFKLLLPFMEHSLECADKVAIFCRLLALESKSRYKFYKENPPIRVYVFVDRISCVPSHTNTNAPAIMCFSWLIFLKGFKGNPTLHWILTHELRQNTLI
jgi:hypothetical protein